MGKWFNWPPFVAVAIDTDTGKPVDPNIGMRTRREFYNIGKDGKGKKVLIAHKSPAGSQAGGGSRGRRCGGRQRSGGWARRWPTAGPPLGFSSAAASPLYNSSSLHTHARTHTHARVRTCTKPHCPRKGILPV